MRRCWFYRLQKFASNQLCLFFDPDLPMNTQQVGFHVALQDLPPYQSYPSMHRLVISLSFFPSLFLFPLFSFSLSLTLPSSPSINPKIQTLKLIPFQPQTLQYSFYRSFFLKMPLIFTEPNCQISHPRKERNRERGKEIYSNLFVNGTPLVVKKKLYLFISFFSSSQRTFSRNHQSKSLTSQNKRIVFC